MRSNNSGTAQLLGVIAVVLAVTLLGAALVSLQDRQRDLLLEGNQLYSPEAVVIVAGPEDVLQAIDRSQNELHAFFLPETAPGLRVLALPEGQEFYAPVHAGEGPAAADQGTALVGSQAQTSTHDGKESVTYDDEHYTVIGTLGSTPESLLQHHTLIVDNALFTAQTGGTVVVDGPNARKDMQELLPGAQLLDPPGGVERRTTVDFLSPILFGLGSSLVVAGWISCGIFMGYSFRRIYRILRLVGHGPRRLLLRHLLTAVAISGCGGGVALLVAWSLPWLQPSVTIAGTLVPAAILVTSIASFPPIVRRKKEDA